MPQLAHEQDSPLYSCLSTAAAPEFSEQSRKAW
jgi:hypothetical protein